MALFAAFFNAIVPNMKNLFSILFLFSLHSTVAQPLEYIVLDSAKQKWGDWANPGWLRYFGLDAGDVNQDGLLDIVSGRYIYRNPGGDMEGPWEKVVLDDNVDAIFVLDVDDDPFADIIAQALPGIFWYEATDGEGLKYKRKKVAHIPATSHVNSQGFTKAQLVPGGKPELLIAGDGDVYCIQLPTDASASWKTTLVAENTSDEGIGVGDIDNDGDLDIAVGRRPEGQYEPTIVVWFENPGSLEAPWKGKEIGKSIYPVDRVAIADLNGDNRQDIIITEERYPGNDPDGHLFWYENPKEATNDWLRHEVVQQYSMNNLKVIDWDEDGDFDLLTNEHKGPNLELQLWTNDGDGNFEKTVLDCGKESHLGVKVADLDGDGGLDIYSAAWDFYNWMHLWKNDKTRPPKEGDVLREYAWKPSQIFENEDFLRVGGKLDYGTNETFVSKAGNKEGWILLTPNLDLENAVKAEVVVERVQSHSGTKDLQIQVGNGEWKNVPWPTQLPDSSAHRYMFHHSPVIPLLMKSLEGQKEARFRLRVGKEHPWNWPQNLVYGVVLRIYYNSEKPNDSYQLKIVSDQTDLEKPKLVIQEPSKEIKKVEFIGLYEGPDLEGEGIYKKWQYHYHQGELKGHISTTTSQPFEAIWDLSQLPIQQGGIKALARIHTSPGLIYLTNQVSLNKGNSSQTKVLIKPMATPPDWVTRNQEYTQKWWIPDRSAAIESAEMIWRSWSPCYNEGILINGNPVKIQEKGPCYRYAVHRIPVDPSVLESGWNTVTTLKTPLVDGKMVHGMEVQWPGIMLNLGYEAPPKASMMYEAMYEGRDHFVINTPYITYYYDKKGGGFSRMIDREGNDWIAFRKEPWNEYPASAASSFRGIPNLVFKTKDGGAGHPGFDKCTSKWIAPNQVKTTSNSGDWSWSWTFFDTYAHLKVESVPSDGKYWFLYEGTPGGRYRPGSYYFGTDISRSMPGSLPDFYQKSLLEGDFQWMYAGDTTVERTFFMLQLGADGHADVLSYLGNSEQGAPSEDGMTVFGFGRNRKTEPLLSKPEEFVIGFYPKKVLTKSDHRGLSKFLDQVAHSIKTK